MSKSTIKDFTVLIAAAGRGSRFDEKLPKQYWNVGGKTILRHTIDKFLNIEGLKKVHVLIHPDHQDLYESAIKGLNLPAPILGGNERKDSIYSGLKHLSKLKNEDLILIHDAARPFFREDDIFKLLDSLKTFDAAALCHTAPNTLFDSKNETYLDRTKVLSVQTPQGFHYGTILEAHKKYEHSDQQFTDDTSLILAMGKEMDFVGSYQHNIKITTKDDLAMAHALLKSNIITRTGLGFDVHAFAEEPSKNIRLGGIDIEHHKSLKGHSDADVVLHTITDALMGAVAAGDIGDHFPPSDNSYKNMDSAVFLKKASDILSNQNAEIINIDVTIMCEAPKIGPHKERMRSRIAEILDISVDKISIKATTTEKLGFTGREEGIAAQAVANVSVPI